MTFTIEFGGEQYSFEYKVPGLLGDERDQERMMDRFDLGEDSESCHQPAHRHHTVLTAPHTDAAIGRVCWNDPLNSQFVVSFSTRKPLNYKLQVDIENDIRKAIIRHG